MAATKTYNRDGAIAYAARWCNSHNPDYVNYDNDASSSTSNCANFVSQCMYEGGGMPMKYTTNNGSYDSWYYNTPGQGLTSKSGSWAGAQSLRLFVKTNTVGYPRMPYEFLSNSEVGQLQKGDLVFALNKDGSSKSNRTAKHVAMVSRIVGTTIYVYANSDPKNDQPWNYALADTILCKFDGTILLGSDTGSGSGTGNTDSWQARYGTETLKRTSTSTNVVNSYVINLQEDLMFLGYDVGSAGADGKFGYDTENAVKAFQRAADLTVDGKAGNATKTALFNAIYQG